MSRTPDVVRIRGGAATRGFTLPEIVIALLVLELAVVGAVGMLVLASATLSRAERLERAAARAEGVLDSLALTATPIDGTVSYEAGEIRWVVGAGGELRLVAGGPTGDTVLDLTSILPPGVAAP
jgi:type II secretory pathway pseudopilin PulG